MKKLRTKSSRNDPNSWAGCSNMWPTKQGTYETSCSFADATKTALTTGGTETADTWRCFWVFKSLSGAQWRSYICGAKPWEVTNSGGFTLTDRSGGASMLATFLMQYGDITIMCRGTGSTLASSSGGNFTAIAGAPSAYFGVVARNTVVVFNTATAPDGWQASDVGDYTNWTTGEAASGRILENNGELTGAVQWGDDILVFKKDAIFRMRYVGGTVKWTIERIVNGIGCTGNAIGPPQGANHISPIVATDLGIFFPFSGYTSSEQHTAYYMFDGVSQPRCVTDEYEPPGPIAYGGLTSPVLTLGAPVFDAQSGIISLVTQYQGFVSNTGNRPSYFYNTEVDAWGIGSDPHANDASLPMLLCRGESNVMRIAFGASLRGLMASFLPGTGGGTLYVNSTTATNSWIKTPKIGRPDRLTQFSRVTPLLRRRITAAGNLTLDMNLYHELHDDTAATARTAIAEATNRARFDLLGGANTDNFADFKVKFNSGASGEIDDALVAQADMGAN